MCDLARAVKDIGSGGQQSVGILRREGILPVPDCLSGGVDKVVVARVALQKTCKCRLSVPEILHLAVRHPDESVPVVIACQQFRQLSDLARAVKGIGSGGQQPVGVLRRESVGYVGQCPLGGTDEVVIARVTAHQPGKGRFAVLQILDSAVRQPDQPVQHIVPGEQGGRIGHGAVLTEGPRSDRQKPVGAETVDTARLAADRLFCFIYVVVGAVAVRDESHKLRFVLHIVAYLAVPVAPKTVPDADGGLSRRILQEQSAVVVRIEAVVLHAAEAVAPAHDLRIAEPSFGEILFHHVGADIALVTEQSCPAPLGLDRDSGQLPGSRRNRRHDAGMGQGAEVDYGFRGLTAVRVNGHKINRHRLVIYNYTADFRFRDTDIAAILDERTDRIDPAGRQFRIPFHPRVGMTVVAQTCLLQANSAQCRIFLFHCRRR